MYNDKSSDYSEQLCSPQDYPVSDKEVINMNCKDPSLKIEVTDLSLYNLLPLIFSLTLYIIIMLNIFSSYYWSSSVHVSILFSSKTLKMN